MAGTAIEAWIVIIARRFPFVSVGRSVTVLNVGSLYNRPHDVKIQTRNINLKKKAMTKS